MTAVKVDREKVLQTLEWKRCAESAEYFFENYYYIPVVGIGPRLFKLRDYQRETLGSIHERDHIVSLKARQIGMTTILVGYALWYSIFHNDSPWLFISRNEGAAQKMLQRAKYAFIRLPKWMKDKIGKPVSETQGMLEFQNGSYLESIPATGGTGRGDSVYGVIMDEVGFMDYGEEIWAAVEPLVYGKYFLISTANGMGNFFHEIWLDSERDDSVWRGLFFPWFVVPSRDEAWYETRRLAHRGRDWYFYQEYPSTASEAFAKSGRLAFPLDLMDYCEWNAPVQYYEWDGERLTLVDDPENYDVVLEVWEEPYTLVDDDGLLVQQPNFAVACDVAEGLEHGDYTVVKVLDLNTGEEVASSRSHIPVELVGAFLEHIGYWYYTAIIGVERNNHGLVPIVWLQEHLYPRLYRVKEMGRRERKRIRDYGWHTSIKTKPKMVKDFLRALRDREVIMHDKEFMYEAQTFVSNGRGSYDATAGKHDDTIMAMLIGWQLYEDSERFPIVWRDTTERPLTFDQVFEFGERQLPRGILDTPIGDVAPTGGITRSFFVKPENLNRQK